MKCSIWEGSIGDSEFAENSFYARLKQVRNRVRNEDLRDCHRSQYIEISEVSDCAVSCRKVAEFDTPLLCETRYRNNKDDNRILCKQEGRAAVSRRTLFRVEFHCSAWRKDVGKCFS